MSEFAACANAGKSRVGLSALMKQMSDSQPTDDFTAIKKINIEDGSKLRGQELFWYHNNHNI
jgi:hypothetical protein